MSLKIIALFLPILTNFLGGPVQKLLFYSSLGEFLEKSDKIP